MAETLQSKSPFSSQSGLTGKILAFKCPCEASRDLARKHGDYFERSSRRLSSSHDQGAELSFLKEAERLTTDPRFRTETRYAGNALIYIRALCDKGLGDDLYCGDLSKLITEYELEQCDRTALFSPGTYLRQTDTYAPKSMYQKTWMYDPGSASSD
jgi:hypothetical protein